MSAATSVELAEQAALEYRRRHTRAHQAVRKDQTDVTTATAHLRPWLAIACLCGAELPELEDGIAERRTLQVVWSSDPAGQPPEVSEAQARALLADDICPRVRWAPVLAKARDAAYLNLPTTAYVTAEQRAEQHRSALALRDIANHLAFDPNGRHPVPPLDLPAILRAREVQEAA